MLMVIWGHLVYFDLTCGADTWLTRCFFLFRMPLFFFVSGFVAYKAEAGAEWLRQKMSNRVFKQLLPTVAVGLIFCFTHGMSHRVLFLTDMRAGYWFTATLFEVFVVYALLNFVMTRFGVRHGMRNAVWAALLVASTVVYYLYISGKMQLSENDVQRGFGLVQFFRNAKYFLLGLLARAYCRRFIALIEKTWLMTAVAVVFVVVYSLWCEHFSLSSPMHWARSLRIPMSVMGVVLMWRFFHSFRGVFNTSSAVGRLLTLIGRNTLPVFLLDYFFIEARRQLKNTAIGEAAASNAVVEVVLCLTLSLSIALSTIYIDKALKFLPPLRGLVSGFDLKKK